MYVETTKITFKIIIMIITNRKKTSTIVLLIITVILSNFNYCVVAEEQQEEDDNNNGEDSEIPWYSLRYYSLDGTGNNLNHNELGSAMTNRVRLLPNISSYVDGISMPRYEDLPSARNVMEQIFHTATPRDDKISNHLLLEFGHFIVQDVIGRTKMNESEPFPMPCDGEIFDYVFCPVTKQQYQVSKLEIPFPRSQHVPGIIPRATLNGETHFMDMSNMYGTTEERMNQVRSRIDGKVKLDEDGLPEIQEDKYNSSPGVFSLYVVFLRYHNLLAEEYKEENSDRTDEELFQLARRKNIAVYQKIAEESYIPSLLGDKLAVYEEYDPNVDPNIDEFFAAVSFRYAHSSFSSFVRMLDENFVPIATDPLALRDVFRQEEPNDVQRIVRNNGGVEVFLRGMTVQNAKAVDASFVKDFNFFLEATTMLDVQRARDLGIPSYNDVREAFGLERILSFEDLAVDDTNLADALKTLYNSRIDDLDAYVGALIELPEAGTNLFLGQLMTKSIKDQFERLRDGDRFWYRNIFDQEDWENFETLDEIVKRTCDGMDYFPGDEFRAWDGNVGNSEDGTCQAQQATLTLMKGDFILEWAFKDEEETTERLIDVTLATMKEMSQPGYLGVGWRESKMKDAEIWFCTINEADFNSYRASLPENAFPDECTPEDNVGKPMFSCCLASGKAQVMPECSTEDDGVYYKLEVIDWCLTQEKSEVVVQAPVCADDVTDANFDGNCFRLTSDSSNDEIDFIVAYNVNGLTSPHGMNQRTNAKANLNEGIQTVAETTVSDTGLIVTHALFMLFSWMVLAPLAIFVVRYIKTKTWRLAFHVSLMGIVGSLMVPLLIGIEAAVGATDKSENHAAVGIFLMFIFFFMAAAGRVQYLKLQGQKVGRKTYFLSTLLHKYGGVIIVWLSWWNCYTGLLRIGPNDTYFEIWLLNTRAFGYELPIFEYIRVNIFPYYVACVCVIFAIAEARRYRALGSGHKSKLQGVLDGEVSLWEEGADQFLEKMTFSAFLDSTRNGSALCIVDGYVLDITNFMENHPGGQHLLRYAVGSDITEEFVGVMDVDGQKHCHSNSALQLMRTFVKAILVDDESKTKMSFQSGKSLHISQRGSKPESRAPTSTTRRGGSVFRRGRIMDIKYLTPDIDVTHTSKPVILLSLALPKSRSKLDAQKLVAIPSCAFTFRTIDKNRVTVERQYTPVNIAYDVDSTEKGQDEEVFDFVISLVPGGMMSKFLLNSRPGKMILVQGPTVNPQTVNIFGRGEWKTVVMIAAGTGISPMLQLIDFYLSKQNRGKESLMSEDEGPTLYLVWIVKNTEFDYSDELGLVSRMARSYGSFKYIIIYSSKERNEEQRRRESIGKTNNRWTFRDIVDKTAPYSLLHAGSVAVRSSLGIAKTKKVKRLVVDAASRLTVTSTRSRSWKAMPSLAEEELTREESTSKELTSSIWSGDVSKLSRSYDADFLEELLSSIPTDDRKKMSSIVEFASKDNESTTTTESRGDSKSSTSTPDSKSGEKEEEDERGNKSQLPRRPRSSWLPPTEDDKVSLVSSLKSVPKRAAEDDSLNHSNLKDGVVHRKDAESPIRTRRPGPEEQNARRPGTRGGGRFLRGKRPGLEDQQESFRPALIPSTDRGKSISSETSKTEIIHGFSGISDDNFSSGEESSDNEEEEITLTEQDLKDLEGGRLPSIKPKQSSSTFQTRLRYEKRKMLVVISGSPMFEYESKVMLDDINFPKDQSVTFHSSTQPL